MRIAFVLSRDPMTSGGGVDKYVLKVAQELMRAKIRPIIISPKETDETLLNYIPINGKLKDNIQFMFKLFRKTPFIKLTPDTVIAAQRADFLFPFILFNKGGLKGIHIHGQQYKAVSEKGRIYDKIYSRIERYSIKRSDFLIFTDKQTRMEYEKKYHQLIKNKNKKIIPVGIDTNIFKPMNKLESRKKTKLPLDKKIIITVGRVNPEKRFDLAILAFQKILKKNKNTILVLIGDGPEKIQLEALVNKIGLNDNVIFTGSIANENLPEYLNSADLFLLSSDREGSPIVIREAIGCGLPVVTTNVGDVKDIINDKIGIIVKKGDVDDLAKKIIIALKRNWDLKYIQESANQFTWRNIIKRILKVYKNY